MGYDCTLHLIDENAIRDQFVPRLLGRSHSPTALDRMVKKAAELWAQVNTALQDDDPENAAAMLCQLAVMFSACSLPHRYERGLALCLLANQEPDIAFKYPTRFSFSPEPLFAEVVEKYPALHGRFPTWFTGNGSTGVFIPSDGVPDVLAWIEKKVQAFPKGDQRHFKGMLGILRTAAEKRLAYWEATDLAIPMANQNPGDPNLMLASFMGNDPGSPGARVEEAPLDGNCPVLSEVIVDHWLLSGDDNSFETNVWDLSMWPPPLVHTLNGFATAMARSRDGRWLFLSETNPVAKRRTFRPFLYSNLSKPCDGRFPLRIGRAESDLDGCAFFGARPVVFLTKPWNAKPGSKLLPPYWLEGSAWKPIHGLPSVDATQRPGSFGVLQLRDGADVIIWNGNGYELHGDHFQMTFPIDAKGKEQYWTFVPAGTDGFFYLSNRCLFEVHRNGSPTPHAQKWKNIMFIRRGPSGTILVQEGENKDGDVGKLYFLGEDTFIHIGPELFDDEEYRFIYWSEPTDRFIVLREQWLAVSTTTVLNLPRYRVSTGRKIKSA